jgi:hypothetical protein
VLQRKGKQQRLERPGIRKSDPREGGKKACNRSQGITKEAASTSLYYSD